MQGPRRGEQPGSLREQASGSGRLEAGSRRGWGGEWPRGPADQPRRLDSGDNAPQDVPALIPRTCDYVTLHGRGGFVNVMKLRILRWGNDPGLTRWVQCNCKVLMRGGQRARVRERDVRTDAEVREMHFEDGRRGHEPRNVGGLWKDTESPLEPQKEPALQTPRS